MTKAKTLVHKAAMPVALHAVRTFAACHAGMFSLEIHSDGSLEAKDIEELQRVGQGLELRIVTPAERQICLQEKLLLFPTIAALLNGSGYFTKLELPIVEDEPYFYFDSDVVWLRPCPSVAPKNSPNAFSTESWSWYYGMKHPRCWIQDKVPRRVNSGFYYLSDPFPFDRMEMMLAKDHFDPQAERNTDQEIFAYLFRNMKMYDTSVFQRSRRGIIYKLDELKSTALHFPGRMWVPHLDQLESFVPNMEVSSAAPIFNHAKNLSIMDIYQMKLFRLLETNTATQHGVRLYRNLRKLRA